MPETSTETRLLIFDDDPSIGATIALMATSGKMTCRYASTANDFYAALESWKPTHIALDLVMPDHDGIEVLHRLAEKGCHARIIITSGVDGRVLEAAHRSAMEHGLNIAGAIAKPFSLASLRGLLAQAPPQIEATERVSKHSPIPSLEVSREMVVAAMDGNQLYMVFQPKVTCADGQLIGFEGLVRWQHPQHGTIAPDQFIPLVEQSGLSDRLTEIVFEAALGWFSERRTSSLSLALNISAVSLDHLGMADRLAGLCEKHMLSPSSVIIEITESSAMNDQTAALDLLTRFRLKGFKLSIDDFGTGYSSLVQLARMPFSELKIDRSFVMTAMHSTESRNIISAIIGLGKSLGLHTVAEGVEDLATFSFLKEAGCDMAQGYFIGRPMSGDAISRWMGTDFEQSGAN